ncbi:DUF3012 domain-containing protein [Photobacterium sp. MCCC 1A19761]|uniref:DUF3012 domain-containing protein n=1 Tax=Photobacterium sp. MCCC 1A19761 TaxID=3115000 RepID=UPI00307FBE38
MRLKFQHALLTTALLFGVLLMQGCSPEVGSKEWCDEMKQQPKGDWTANEAKDYAKHCIF